MLFIALAHGGIAAGMDTYLRYCDEIGSQNSTFYVVRYSSQKQKDTEPRLSAGEIEYLKKASEGRQVVLFDEDAASGNTITSAHKYFSNKVFPGKHLIVAVNLGMTEEFNKLNTPKPVKSAEPVLSSSDDHFMFILPANWPVQPQSFNHDNDGPAITPPINYYEKGHYANGFEKLPPSFNTLKPEMIEKILKMYPAKEVTINAAEKAADVAADVSN